jgi:hypothetical protein
MNKLLAKISRPASDSETAGSVSAAPARLGRIARIARVVVVPVVAVAALACAAGSAHAATSSLGTIDTTVYCITDLVNHTSQIKVAPSADQNPRFTAGQWVAYRYGYYPRDDTRLSFVASGWSGATLVNDTHPISTVGGEPITVTKPIPLPPGLLNATFASGRIAHFYVQGAFWNGTAYEYSSWSTAGTTYIAVNDYGNGQGPVPCSV